MDDRAPFPAPPRLATGVPGLDAVLGGGLLEGDAYLVAGPPGAGKTTLGAQLAFAHAAAGGRALVATLLTESHDRLLGHLAGFAFFDPALLGDRVRLLSLLRPLEEGGVDGLLEALWAAVRESGATLLVLDGARGAEAVAPSGVGFARFVHGLQARAGLVGCTAVLLASGKPGKYGAAGTHVDGVLELSRVRAGAGEGRRLRVAKLRGGAHLAGHHAVAIGPAGVAVHPRLEAALAGAVPRPLDAGARVPFGVAGLDAMLGGGLPSGAACLVLGTPGAGKTVLGVHFAAEGARRGEPVLIASFRETAADLAGLAAGLGLDLAPHLASGLVRVHWRPPLEVSPDAWAWGLLAAGDAHRPRRLVVDAYTDLARAFPDETRAVGFLTALANELRGRGVTAQFSAELEAWAGQSLLPPIPAVSGAADAGILLRVAELGSRLVRVATVLKLHGAGFDPAIRQMEIGPGGMAVGGTVDAATGLLTGSAVPRQGAGAGNAG